MEINELYKLKSNFVVRAVGDELILVPLSANVAQMNELFTMNETGRFIWENLNENSTLKSLESLMIENFEVEQDIAKNDLDNFIQKIKAIL